MIVATSNFFNFITPLARIYETMKLVYLQHVELNWKYGFRQLVACLQDIRTHGRDDCIINVNNKATNKNNIDNKKKKKGKICF